MTVLAAGISASQYLRLICLPTIFLILALIPIAIQWSWGTFSVDDHLGGQLINGHLLSGTLVNNWRDNKLISININKLNFWISKESGTYSLFIGLKALAAISCLYFLILTTPMLEVLSCLQKIKVPKLILEMLALIYRFIFILLETANSLYVAQSSRLGHSSIKIRYRSLSMLLTSLLVLSYKHSQEMYYAMESKGYDGELKFFPLQHYENKLPREQITIKYLWGAVILFEILLLLMAIRGHHIC